jgi:serine/arginine repetitive matrix protein 2
VSFLRFDIFCLLIISSTIVPERIPIRDDDNDYDDADDVHESRNRSSLTPHHSEPDDDDDDSLPRASINSKNIVVDIETSPEAPKLQIPPSPSSAVAVSNDSRIFPVRLSISSPSQPELPSPNTEYMGWDDSPRVIVTDASPKKNGEGSQSRWGKMKNAFSRPGSSIGKRPRNDSIQERGNNANSSTLRSNGTRSRNNSIRDRATNTDSSTSRESGASLTGASKTDKGE